MSIEVISTGNQQKVDPVEEKAAPESIETSEQNKPVESETTETEEKEVKAKDKEDEESDESEDLDEVEKPKKKGGFQRRIDKLNARYSAAQAEIEHWKAMALKGAGEPKQEKPEHKAVPQLNEGKPDPEHFETHAEYVEALTDWKLEQREKAKSLEAEKAKVLTEQEKLTQSYIERLNTFKKTAEDYEDVVSEVDDIPLSQAIQTSIIESEVGPQITYELAKNRKELERIASLNPLAAAREIGKIEAKLLLQSSEEKKPETKKTTKAPQPIAPVSAKGQSVTKSIFDKNLSQAEYEALRREQKRTSSWGA